MKPVRRALRLVAINAGILAAGLLVLELAFGSWVVGPNFGNLNLPRKVERHFDTAPLYAGGGPIRYVRDAYGLRGRYAEPAAIDVVTVGGSTTNELYVDEGRTWTDVLGRELARRGLPLAVVNAGADGQSTVGHLRALEAWYPLIPGFRPRWAILYVGINDAAFDPDSAFDAMRSTDRARRIRYYFVNNSALYHLYRTLAGMARARDARVIHGGSAVPRAWGRVEPAPDLAREGERLAPALAAYRARLLALAQGWRALGAEPVFVTQPRGDYRLRDDGLWGPMGADGGATPGGYVAMTLYNRTLLGACAEVRAVCVDLAGALHFADGDFYDAIHTTPQGSERIGRFLAERLAPVLRGGAGAARGAGLSAPSRLAILAPAAARERISAP